MRKIFKRIFSIFVLIALALPFFSFATLAAEDDSTSFWSEEYYRASDSLKDLSELERDKLDEMCIDFMIEHEVDLVLLSVLPQEYEETSLQELAGDYYADYEFGYGSEKSGIVFICDMVNREADYALFGDAVGLVEQSYLDFGAKSAMEFYSTNGIYGVLYSGGKFIINYFEDGGTDYEAETAVSEGIVGAESETMDEASDIAGYGGTSGTTSKGNAQADMSLPRVVDMADIFSDQEERDIESRIYEILSEIACDIVVVTDKTAGGKTKEVYADDFYDNGGYGAGADFEGACLFICMDPDDRGFWVSLYGPRTRAPYTEWVANEMDAALQSFLKAGRYAEGVGDWIDNFHRLLTTGEPFTPSWLSESKDNAEKFLDSESEMVDDAAHVLTDEEYIALTKKAQAISQENDMDVVLHIARDPGSSVSVEEYADQYCRHMGYGVDFDGIALISLSRYGGKYETYIYTSGSKEEKLTAVNEKRLIGFYEDVLKITDPVDYNRALDLYLDKLNAMEKTGRVPRSLSYWIFIVIAGLLIGLIIGAVFANMASAAMKTVKKGSSADVYLLSGSLRVAGNDHFINTTRDRRYSPVEKRSSSGGSSGRSSYSSGHTSSSGRSHSGSGRSF